MIYKLLKQYFSAKFYRFVLTYLFKKLRKPKYMTVLSLAESIFAFLAYQSQNKSKKLFSHKKRRNKNIVWGTTIMGAESYVKKKSLLSISPLKYFLT